MIDRIAEYRGNYNYMRKGIEKYYAEMNTATIIMLKRVSERMIEAISKMNFYFQDRTYNLRDGTGIGIYNKGVLVDWKGTKSSKIAQSKSKFSVSKHMSPRGNRSATLYQEIDGYDLLQKALSNNRNVGQYSLSIVLFSAVPYAPIVEAGGKSGYNVGAGWFSDQLEPLFESIFKSEWQAMVQRYNKRTKK